MESIEPASLELTPEVLAELMAEERAQKAKVLEVVRGECDAAIRAMKPIHEMMIGNLRQYEGKSRGVSATKREHATGDASGPPVLHATRSKTDLVEARISDMLFPTAQAQWRFDPEPKQSTDIDVPPEKMVNPDGSEITKEQFAEVLDELTRDRVRKLETEVRDQFTEAKFPQISRKVIRDACRLGFGVFIGPTNTVKRREKYIRRPVEARGLFSKIVGAIGGVFGQEQPPVPTEVEVHVEITEETQPGLEYGVPWLFFPQPVEDLSKASYFYYLELMTESELREMAQNPDADSDAIAELIANKKIEYGLVGAVINEWNNKTGFGENLANRYPVWRRYGCLSHEQMKQLNGCECDPLQPVPMTQVWFCMDKVLMVKESALKGSYRIPAHVFAPFPDVAGWWGLGVPWLCRDSQRSAQAAYEIALHNAAVSSGPLVFYRSELEPADGIMEHRGPKWVRVTDSDQSLKDLISATIIPNNVEMCLGLMDRNLAIMDEDINLPQFTNPEVNKPTNTMSGMAMWINAQTVVQRRAAAAFDDCIQPMLCEFVRWNRLYSEDPEIQVDVQVVPLGQSELLVKDVQVQHAMMFAEMAKPGGVMDGRVDMGVIAKHVAQKFEMPEGAVLTDAQVEERQKNQQQDPAMMAEQAKLQLAQGELQLQQQKLAAETADKERDDAFRREDRELDHEERMRELAIKERQQQLDAFKIREQIQLKLMELQQKAELSREDMQLKAAMAEMDRDLAQYQTSFKGTIEAQKLATNRSEMALKLSPANPTNTGI